MSPRPRSPCRRRSAGSAELFLVAGATHVDPHVDPYDRNHYVAPAVAKLIAFFPKHLV
ncbi:hypothetical protein ACPA54_27885 [Uniformispora flossi]|uniref:hypothetical protein n=1 Tax=Uniformispora flossi TaxID=3390723 RepID=UPI003C2C5F8D